MEPERSLPHSQASATCPYPEPYQSSSWIPIPLLEDPFYYYPPMYAYFFQVVSFTQVTHTKTLYVPLVPPYVSHAPPTSFCLITRIIVQIIKLTTTN
jgi:hypothetical protein